MEYESFIIFLKSLGKLSKMDESLIRRSFNPYVYRKNKVIHKFQFADYSTGPSGENLSHALMIKSSTVGGYMVYDSSTDEDYFVDNSGFNSNQIFTF